MGIFLKFDQWEQFRRLMSALDPDSELFDRMNTCGERRGYENNPYRFPCNQPGCPSCRRRQIRWRTRRAIQHFEGTSNATMAHLTVVGPTTRQVEQVPETFSRMRQTIRNLARKPHFRAVRLVGSLETDAVGFDQLPCLGDQRRALFDALGCWPTETQPLWVPTIHAVVHLGGLTHQDLGHELRRVWSAPRQVHTEPFHQQCSLPENIARTISYGLKHVCATALQTDVGVCHDPWPAEWLGAYYSALHAHASGFRGLTLSRGVSKRREMSGNPSVEEEHSLDCDLGRYGVMPVLVSTMNDYSAPYIL